jgi:hypothetical protein
MIAVIDRNPSVLRKSERIAGWRGQGLEILTNLLPHALAMDLRKCSGVGLGEGVTCQVVERRSKAVCL